MASRTSTLVQATRGALLYHNDSTKAQLVTIHGVSNSTTDNPQVTLLLNNNAAAPINFEIAQFDLAGAGNLVNLGVYGSGANAFSNTQSSFSYLGDPAGTAFSGSVNADGNNYRTRFQHVDPWMFSKPSEYGNADDNTLQFIATNHNFDIGAWHNIADGIRNNNVSVADLLSGTDTSSDNDTGVSYDNRGYCYDQHTQTAISIHSNAYMSGAVYRRQNGWATGNSTSGSILYGRVINGSYDVENYFVSNDRLNSWSPALSSDGGVFVVNFQHYTQSYHRTAFHPGPRALYGGTLPTDHSITDSNTVTLGSNLAISDMLSDNTARMSYIQTASSTDDEFQWFKWNKAVDKYYVCFKSGTGNAAHSGIWEVGYDALTNGAWSEGNIAGGGPNGQNQYSTSDYGWTKVGEYPVPQSRRCTIPSKVGANLWLIYDDNSVAYFSEDLKTWTVASSFIAGGYTIKNQNSAGVDFFRKSDGSVITTTTGIAEMSQAGLLEKNTAIGNYTRSGLVLNPGDCIFTENHDTSNSVSFTVTEVAI